jgi:N6-L-threonylcarbamoyladenine synthase
MAVMPEKKKAIVAFDTSNYTTSIAVCDTDGEVIANLKAPLPVKTGERGLRQSDAVFAHTKNLPALCDKLSEEIKELDIVAVGVSSTPRCAENSYMPCFLCGIAAAHSFASHRGLKVFETSHQNGHIMAAVYSSGAAEKLLKNRFLAFHVSGGTTEALLVTPSKNGAEFDVALVGETDDINAGQAIDRVGVMLGLSFPCGKELEMLAASYSGRIEKKQVCVRDGKCSLSGVENIAQNMYSQGKSKEEIAAFVFDFICRTLIKMTEQTLDKYGEMPVIYAGGVMSNILMRAELSRRFDAHFAMPEFSADNAAGVALITQRKLLREEFI